MSNNTNLFITNINDILKWSRASSLWTMSFGLACCAIEMMGAFASKYDLDRFGSFTRSSPRQSDLIIISGTVTFKMMEPIKNLYNQMPSPKYVISMGSCSNCGGPYFNYGYHVLKGVNKIIPVDIYVQGCPPRPEALIDAIISLQKKIKK
ncbi:MAG: NADH-quinone oxidoreductase subunit B [Bacteroides sp.]|nr:MAG: NADH-quinone oxidoreductase subunit B [Bacteroides sp.]